MATRVISAGGKHQSISKPSIFICSRNAYFLGQQGWAWRRLLQVFGPRSGK
jgi:hypothetical protein